MRVNLEERRASANEAMLGLNGYANLLAASMATNPGSSGKTRKLVVKHHSPGSPQQQPNASVEEEGASYLSRYGSHKRNTVALGSPLSASTTAQHRHSRTTPYAKQSPTGSNNERRSSWASSSNNPTQLNSQQFSRLESIYSQSIRGSGSGTNGIDGQRHSLGANEHLSSIQQLQFEFQKLQACTERPSPANVSGTSPGGMDASSTVNAPTISITDENNRSFGASPGPYDPFNSMQPGDNKNSGKRPATIVGFSSTAPGSPAEQVTNSSHSITQQQPSTTTGNGAVKFVFIPIPPTVALDRIHRFVREHQFVCEVRPADEGSGNGRNNQCLNNPPIFPDSIEVRIAPNSETIVSLIIHKMPDSSSVSKTEFSVVKGDADESDALRANLMAVFNEVC